MLFALSYSEIFIILDHENAFSRLLGVSFIPSNSATQTSGIYLALILVVGAQDMSGQLSTMYLLWEGPTILLSHWHKFGKPPTTHAASPNLIEPSHSIALTVTIPTTDCETYRPLCPFSSLAASVLIIESL